MRKAIYTRKSTKKQQDIQLEPLRSLASTLDGEIVHEYIDCVSGAKSDREQFLQMLKDSDKGKFDLLLIWSLDRFSREGISNTLGYLERLKRNGVAVKSLQESWLDTRDEGLGQLMLAILSWVAAQERVRLGVRVKEGMKKAKAEGKHMGRPAGSKDKKRRIRSGYLARHRREE